MNIVFAIIISIGIKGIAAGLEIITQMLMTNYVGVSEYGTYTFFISLVEGIYWLLYSGSVKLNTYYLSTSEVVLTRFKRKYLVKFVLPTISFIILYFVLTGKSYGVLVGLTILIYYLAFDQSSTLFARGRQLPALIGEYLIGRVLLLCGVIIAIKAHYADSNTLFVLYGLQFISMLAWFLFLNKNKKTTKDNIEIEVPIKKLVEYQFSDVANSLVSYSPAVLQYTIAGAFSAGFTGIVTIISKIINFIAGPTAKVFLPEFSKLYKAGELKQLHQTYIMVIRVQMVFVGTMGALLIGFPKLFLNLFNPDLISYSFAFTLTAVSFIFISSMGPVIGFLQMTGNEHVCNRNQWISIIIMIISWILLRKEILFAVFGLCIQNIVQGILNYYSASHWLGKNVVPLKNCILLWGPIIIVRIIVDTMGFQFSYLALVITACCAFAWNLIFAWEDPMIQNVIRKKLAIDKMK